MFLFQLAALINKGTVTDFSGFSSFLALNPKIYAQAKEISFFSALKASKKVSDTTKKQVEELERKY